MWNKKKKCLSNRISVISNISYCPLNLKKDDDVSKYFFGSTVDNLWRDDVGNLLSRAGAVLATASGSSAAAAAPSGPAATAAAVAARRTGVVLVILPLDFHQPCRHTIPTPSSTQ